MKLAIHFHLTEIYPHTSVHLHCVTLSQRAAVSIRNTVVLDDQYEKHHVLIWTLHDDVSEFSNLEIVEACWRLNKVQISLITVL